MERIKLLPKEDRRLLRGHLWVYRNECHPIKGLADGEVTDIHADGGRFIGRAFCQATGGIAARILTRHQEEIDRGFFKGRLDEARLLRERLFPGSTVYRWVFGESDGLPGFVADRYGEVVVAQSDCAFYMAHIETLAEIFMRAKGVKGVQFTGCNGISRFGETVRHIETEMDGLKLVIDITQGQKTGMFLDQRLNARTIEPFAKGARVFDGHCNTAPWGCRAALAGAAAVVAVDSSQGALDLAARNARLNDVEGVFSFVCADVASVLASGGDYDVVLLDPPSLAKTRSQAARALPVHQELHRAAINALKPGGVLVTSCCSHFVEPDAFEETLKRAARGARRDVILLERRGASPDHPVLLSMPETAYLTCLSAVVR